MTGPQTKLLVVDDHVVVRMGLATLLGSVEDFNVVGEAASVAQAIEQAHRCQPDVVLMDVRLPDGSGAAACREILSAWPRARVIMLTSYSDEDLVMASVMAGASGYLLKEIDAEQLVGAIRIVAKGGSLLDPAVADRVLNWIRNVGSQNTDGPVVALSPQERKTLLLIAEGKTNREIAATLFISEHSIKTYVSNILHKLHLTRRAEAAAFVARLDRWTM